jgi:hypothetical protein
MVGRDSVEPHSDFVILSSFVIRASSFIDETCYTFSNYDRDPLVGLGDFAKLEPILRLQPAAHTRDTRLWVIDRSMRSVFVRR